MALGEKLLELRKLKGLSQEEVADKLGVTRQTISKWETDQTTPDFDKIIPICELFGITADELLTGNKKDTIQTPQEIKDENLQKKNKAKGIGSGILGFFVAIVWIMIAIPVLKINPIVSSAIFLLISGVATFLIVYTAIVYKKEETLEELRTKKLIKQIDNLLSIFTLIIYLVISFITMAWHITWIIWLIYALVIEIVKLIISLRGDNNEEK